MANTQVPVDAPGEDALGLPARRSADSTHANALARQALEKQLLLEVCVCVLNNFEQSFF